MKYQKTIGAIAAGDPKTTQAGYDILALGGNAFDAAVGATFATFVVESTLASAAGGGFLTAQNASGHASVYDFFTQTPHNHKTKTAQPDFYPIEINFGDDKQEFHVGYGSAAVPGCIAGLMKVHEDLGKLPIKEVLAPAIDLARNGFIANSMQEFCYQLIGPIILERAASRKIYTDASDEVIKEGGKVYMKGFADALDYLATDGARGFYEGDIAKIIVAESEKHGGFLTAEDLSSYQVEVREPLSIKYRGNTILTNPPPSVGGSMICFMLSLLQEHNLSSFPFGGKEHLQRLYLTMKMANKARRAGFDAKIYDNDVLTHFFSKSNITNFSIDIKDALDKVGSTTHLSVIDELGNCASVTTSLGQGNTYMIPGTDMMMNNMLGESDLNPNGWHQWKPNRRVSSNMSPTIINTPDGSVYGLGTGGANRIRTTLTQVISNLTDFDMSIEEAVSMPRIHFDNNKLDIEGGYDENIISKINLQPDDHQLVWKDKNVYFGGVHTVGNQTKKGFVGYGDARRNGKYMCNK